MKAMIGGASSKIQLRFDPHTILVTQSPLPLGTVGTYTIGKSTTNLQFWVQSTSMTLTTTQAALAGLAGGVLLANIGVRPPVGCETNLVTPLCPIPWVTQSNRIRHGIYVCSLNRFLAYYCT
jgi:hypothetical protein